MRKRRDRKKWTRTRPTKKYLWKTHKHNPRRVSKLRRKIARTYRISRTGVGEFKLRLDVHYAEQRRNRNPKKGKGSLRLING